MPEDSKKNHEKKKNDPKEQRKPRQKHQHSNDKKHDKKAEESKSAPKVMVPQKPPVYEEPPPEFFKNLKRETEEIIKITEEENTKYKKKEIQSNWSKYEMPIESYDEIEEQENMGADYEKLIQAPLSIGGHFQFKHEKSWDINTGPSLYDKYFEINMDDLNVALCTIPFYQRNDLDKDIFSQTDILTMDNRATRFKQKYYKDKSYSTAETEAQDKILSSLRDSKDDKSIKDAETNINIDSDDKTHSKCDNVTLDTDINLDFKGIQQEARTIDLVNKIDDENIVATKIDKIETKTIDNKTIINNDSIHDDFIFGVINQPVNVPEVSDNKVSKAEVLNSRVETPSNASNIGKTRNSVNKQSQLKEAIITSPVPSVPKVADTPNDEKKNPVIESPEDLEKWLDDFLDG